MLLYLSLLLIVQCRFGQFYRFFEEVPAGIAKMPFLEQMKSLFAQYMEGNI